MLAWDRVFIKEPGIGKLYLRQYFFFSYCSKQPRELVCSFWKFFHWRFVRMGHLFARSRCFFVGQKWLKNGHVENKHFPLHFGSWHLDRFVSCRALPIPTCAVIFWIEIAHGILLMLCTQYSRLSIRGSGYGEIVFVKVSVKTRYSRSSKQYILKVYFWIFLQDKSKALTLFHRV